MPTFPDPPDKWSEALTHPEGYWTVVTGGEVSLDRINKQVGESSVRVDQPRYMYYLGLIFILYDGQEFDATRENQRFRFYHALPSGFTGDNTLVFTDAENRMAYRSFGTRPTGEWESKDLPVGPGAGYTEDEGFDWTRVKTIRVTCDQEYPGWGTTFWIDAPHFFREAALYYILFDSSPRGKTMTVTGPTGTTTFLTPRTLTLQQFNGTEYTVEADPNRFEHWEDGSTYPTRIFIPTMDTTLFATYTPLVQYSLTIDSIPEGKKFEVDGVSGITPTTYQVSPGTYTVKMPPTGFLYWLDDPSNRNPTRTVDVSTDTTLIALYEEAPPTPEFPWQMMLLAIAIGGSIIVLSEMK